MVEVDDLWIAGSTEQESLLLIEPTNTYWLAFIKTEDYGATCNIQAIKFSIEPGVADDDTSVELGCNIWIRDCSKSEFV